MEKIRGWLRKRPITWALVAFVIGGVIGAAPSSSDSEQAHDDVENLEAQLDSSRAEVNRLTAERDQTIAKEARLAQREASLDQREQDIASTEQTVEENTIIDGIWQVGADFEPGTYRAEGGADCYWALLNSADTSDIANNGGFSPNQAVTLDSGWFETAGCGEWTKIG